MQAQDEQSPGALLSSSSFASQVGLRLVTSGEGRACVVLPLSDAVLTESGGIDSGAVALLIEAAGAAAACSDDPVGAGPADTVDLAISFARSAPEHPLTAEARVLRRERDVCLSEVEVLDWNGDFVARGSVTQRR